MTYIPVGTLLTYTCQFKGPANLISGTISTWQDLAAKLKTDLPNLPGAEELLVESSNGTNVVFSGNNTLAIQVLNNGVDHGSETDVQSLIDGQIQSYFDYTLVSSNITSITLPNNPGDDINQGQTIPTPGVTPNAPLPVAPPPNSPGSFSAGTGKGFSLPSLSGALGTTGTITGGIVLLIVALVALILLLPQGFKGALGAVRR